MTVYALSGAAPEIHPDAYVHPDATVIGNVVIGAESTVWPQAVLRGDYGRIVVGARTSIQDGAVIHCTEDFSTFIGDDCVVGHLAHLEGCVVEDEALIGTGSILLHRVVVRRRALVGAGALLPGGLEVPSGAMALGVPAKIRPDSVDADEIIETVGKYLRNAVRYRAELRRLD